MDDREELLKEAREGMPAEEFQQRFGPESFGNHEALDRIYLISHTWQTHLVEHPSILLDADAFEKARRVTELMEELYQHMGQKD